MEVETWISNNETSSPIPNPLPTEFSNREIFCSGYMGVTNSSRRAAISANMNGKRVFGTLSHPYIVGGRFAWSNGIWFVLVCRQIPAVYLTMSRYTLPLISSGKTYAYTDIGICSANFEDDSLESHFADLTTPFFEWLDPFYSSSYGQFPIGGQPPPSQASPIPSSYYETNLGLGIPVKIIPQSIIDVLNISRINQLNHIEIFPQKWCFSYSPPFFKNGDQNWAGLENENYFEMSESLGAFRIYQCAIQSINPTIGFYPPTQPQQFNQITITENKFIQKTLKYPTLPDTTWPQIKRTRNRTISGYTFVEYAFELKEQPCEIPITVDRALNSSGNDHFCLERSDYDMLMNRFNRIEQRLTELPN